MKNIISLLFFLAFFQSYSQDVIFSQNFLVPETLNSSFTGAIRSTKVGSVFKSQWRNSSLKTSSNFAFVDTWLEGYKIGVGVNFLNQKESGSGYTFNQVNFNFAMAFEIGNSWFFRPSISSGFGMKNYGFQNILLEDQINLNSNSINTSSIDPILLSSQKYFFDFSSSVLFNNKDSWFGLTLRHLNKPDISLTDGGNIPLDIFMSIHAKYNLPVFQNYGTWLGSKSKVYVLANYMNQKTYGRLDLGLQYVFDDKFSLGMTMFTVPDKNINSLSSSLSTFLGLRAKGYRFGYSYDLNTSKLISSGGTHEFSISYDFEINIRALDRYKCVPFF
jgi:type IX secretion system PorP/SprF family membrane protein